MSGDVATGLVARGQELAPSADAPCRFLLARPSVDIVDQLAAGGTIVRLARGETVFVEGDLVDAVYVVRGGEVSLGRRVGRRRVTLMRLRVGEILGDIPVLLRTPAPFDATVEADAMLVRIPIERVLATLDRSPQFARRWIMWLTGRLANAQTRLLSLLAGDVESQVAAVLAQEGCRGATVHLTHDDLAQLVGAQRSSVTRALDSLANAGVVTTGYGKVTILDRQELERIGRT
jgi:CRP/FNR family transcriptional regulator